MGKRTWTEETIVHTLRTRLANDQRCNVAALREAGLGGMYNAARTLFADLCETCGNDWGKVVPKLLVLYGEEEGTADRRIAARQTWTRAEVEHQLRAHYEACGRDATQMRASAMIKAGFRGAYLWLTRQSWYAREFGGSFPRFAAAVLNLDLDAKGHELSGHTYTTDGLYIGAPIELSQREREFLDGMLLGDGTILVDRRNPQRPSAGFQLKSKHLSVAMWAKDLLPGLGGGIHQGTETLRYRYGGELREVQCEKATYYSRSTPYLLPMASRWYAEEPSGRRKIVPEDLALTPSMLLTWYLGDGGVAYDRHGKATLRLHTHSFTHDEVRRLCLAIRGLGVGCAIDGVWGEESQWNLRIPSSQAARFLEIIGPPPVSELAHRWLLRQPKSA